MNLQYIKYLYFGLGDLLKVVKYNIGIFSYELI